jgi:hypothetical protein
MRQSHIDIRSDAIIGEPVPCNRTTGQLKAMNEPHRRVSDWRFRLCAGGFLQMRIKVDRRPQSERYHCSAARVMRHLSLEDDAVLRPFHLGRSFSRCHGNTEYLEFRTWCPGGDGIQADLSRNS